MRRLAAVAGLVDWWRVAPRSHAVVVVLATAFVVGAILTVAGVGGVAVGILTFCFMLTAPTVAFGRLFPALDPWARLVVAGGATIVVLGLVAQSMLWMSAWSPRHGVAAIAVGSAVVLLAPPVIRRLRRRPRADSVSGYMPGATEVTTRSADG